MNINKVLILSVALSYLDHGRIKPARQLLLKLLELEHQPEPKGVRIIYKLKDQAPGFPANN